VYPQDRIDWFGGTPGGRIELSETPAEILERVREAVSRSFQPFRGTTAGLSFTLWMRSRAIGNWQVPRLEARVEALGAYSVVHYQVVGPVMSLVWSLLFLAFLLCAAVANSIASQDPLALYCGLPFLVLLGAFALLMTTLWNRAAGRSLLSIFYRMFDDVRILEALPRGHGRGAPRRPQ
jgi:hypothetical protein